ncbi:MAG TPA: pitrilysin family protein [Gemmatimonadaceae bacterium]|nr:pitrilysin family protein [Gemmatimonadaceae bacterium]
MRTTAVSPEPRALSRVAIIAAVGVALLAPALQAQQRETPPAPGTPKNFRVPASNTVTLGNGMKVTFIPFGKVPKVAMEIEVHTGTIDEGKNDISLAAVMGDLLLEGTTTRTGPQIAREAAEMGGSVTAARGSEVMSVSGEVLSNFGAQLVALIADVVQHPRFDSADLKRILDQHARNNAMALTQPGSIAFKKFREVMYGSHPFANIYPPEEMLRGFTTTRVREFHTANFGAQRAHLYVSGVFDRRAVEAAVRTAFNGWNRGAAATVNVPVIAAKQQVALIDRPKSEQSSMVLGVAAPHPGSPDAVKMQVTDYILGGAFGSRITTNIRESKGFAYSPYSTFMTRKGASIWMEIADVRTNATDSSLTEIFKEIDRLRTQDAQAAELNGIKNNLAGIFTIQNSSRFGLIGQVQFVDMHELGDGYLNNYVKNIMAVTPTDVRDMASKYLDPKKMSLAIVGDKKLVDPQLGKVKPIVP